MSDSQQLVQSHHQNQEDYLESLPLSPQPQLPPDMLLEIFGNVADRATQLTLRSVCKQFRDLMDRYGKPLAVHMDSNANMPQAIW